MSQSIGVITLELENQLGSTGINVFKRKAGDSAWTNIGVIAADATTVNVPALDDNYIYEVRLQNLNGDNPYSLISRGVKLLSPDPDIFPTDITVTATLEKPAGSINAYRFEVYESSNPAVIIDSQTESSPGDTVTYYYAGLTAATDYTLMVTVIASEFSKTYSFPFTTLAVASCSDILNLEVEFNA